MPDGITRVRSALALDQWFGWTLVFCFASIALVDVPMPLSRNGTLEVTLADILGVGLWSWLAFLVVSRRWRPGSTHLAVLVAVAVFLMWFVVVEAIRVVRGDEVLQPLLVLRSTLIPVAAYLILGPSRVDNPRRALNSLVLFELALTLWHLGEWHDMRMSDFLGNSIVYAGLITMLLPANVYVASGRGTRSPSFVRMAAVLNMLAALVLPVWAGSRGVSAVALVGILGCFVIMLGERKFTAVMVGVGFAALVIQASIWWFNPMGSAYGMYRLVPPPSEINPAWANGGRGALDEAQRKTALEEKGKSDAGRGDLAQASIDRIREDPLIGDGVVYFELPDDGVTQQYAAHNFVLEHINAYGAVGFVFYLLLFVTALWKAITWPVRRLSTRHTPLLALLTTAMLFAFSFTQPTSLIMAIMVPYFAAIGGLLVPMTRAATAERSRVSPPRVAGDAP